MQIYELLLKIKSIAKEHNLSTPFIVGGVPRDRVMGNREREIKDVDITTGDKDVLKLAELLAKLLEDAKYRTYDDGHSSIDIQGLRIDFSNNFAAPEIDSELKKANVNITPMKRELYSRDFTMNTLLEDLDFSTIYDVTGEGIDDIKAGLIKCPINSDITIKSDPRRILRAVYFSLKYDFKIEESLKRSMLKYRENIKDLPLQFVQNKMNDIVRLDPKKGLDILIEYKLLSLVELGKPVYDALIQSRQLARAYD